MSEIKKKKRVKRSILRSQLISGWVERKIEDSIAVGENAERCIVCGDIIPEGRQVCYECERSAES